MGLIIVRNSIPLLTIGLLLAERLHTGYPHVWHRLPQGSFPLPSPLLSLYCQGKPFFPHFLQQGMFQWKNLRSLVVFLFSYTIFSSFSSTGYVSMEEFEESCRLLNEHTNSNIPVDSIEDLAKSIDMDKDGHIDFNEFLEAFRLVDHSNSDHLSFKEHSPVNSIHIVS